MTYNIANYTQNWITHNGINGGRVGKGISAQASPGTGCELPNSFCNQHHRNIQDEKKLEFLILCRIFITKFIWSKVVYNTPILGCIIRVSRIYKRVIGNPVATVQTLNDSARN